MRKIISFICAVSLGLGCIYALYFIAFEARGYFVWMPVMALVGLIVSAFWLWEDFIVGPNMSQHPRVSSYGAA
jgi:hypothetical protein